MTKAVKWDELPDKSIGQRKQLIRSIQMQFELMTEKPDQLKNDCRELLSLFSKPINNTEIITLKPLFPLLQKRSGQIALHLFSFLEEAAKNSINPLQIIKALLQARDKALALQALNLSVQMANQGTFKIRRSLVVFLAGLLNVENSPFLTDKEAVLNFSDLVRFYNPGKKSSYKDSLHSLYLYEENKEIRFMAAVLLDELDNYAKTEISRKILGKYFKLFESYLAYSRISYRELLSLQPVSNILPALSKDFRKAEKILGKKLLAEVITKVRWNRLNLGLNSTALTGVSINGSPEFMLRTDSELNLLKKCRDSHVNSQKYFITVCGGQPSGENITEDDCINRFRAYNLVHASLLRDFLDVGPLTVKKIKKIISKMDIIVEDYTALFNAYSNECSILPGIYGVLKACIFAEIEGDRDKPQLSADLTRLVQSFEDPHSLGEVRTLHGLKRYLHQQSLHLGFRLVERSKKPNRTIDLLIAEKEGIQFNLNKIRFAEFESSRHDTVINKNIPLSVELLIDGFERQIVHGMEKFPYVDIFNYGNEVHYYFSFRNHPVFLRIDYAPPQCGGMIDLEYFGVSNYELDHHPNITLDAIQAFFKRMEYDVSLEGTHIHARYDKERAVSLDDIIRKARQVFRLIPYLMDLDWIIGSLAYEKTIRQKVIDAWADFFMHWGFIPHKHVLTKNHSGILCGLVDEPTGKRELVWNGQDSYRDIFTNLPTPGFYKELILIIQKNGLESIITTAPENKYIGQVDLEKVILNPLRKSTQWGELIPTSDGFKLMSDDLFIRIHEAEVFAGFLNEGPDKVSATISVARLVRPFERTLTFETTGSINGYLVQNAVLALRSEVICFYILRRNDGMLISAFFICDEVLYKKRKSKSDYWVSNASVDAARLAVLLHDNNFVDILPKQRNEDFYAEAISFLGEIRASSSPVEKGLLKGERLITGLKASPGRAVGKALFHTKGRNPQDLKGAILVSTSVTPQDTTFIYYAAGIVTTGGGILSHAGLMAMQFGKPALVISGDWQKGVADQPILYYKSLEYQVKTKKINSFNLCIRKDIQEKTYPMYEGDLLIVDVYSGNVHVLGHDRNMLALYEGFQLYLDACKTLASAKQEKEILNLRGIRLRARHQLENTLHRCKDSSTARYAIFEILINEQATERAMSNEDKGALLSIIFNNTFLSSDARDYLLVTLNELKISFNEIIKKAKKDIPTSESIYEILSLRLNVIRAQQADERVIDALKVCETTLPEATNFFREEIESLSVTRLEEIKSNLIKEISSFKSKIENMYIQRHLIRQTERLYRVLDLKDEKDAGISNLRKQQILQDKEELGNYSASYIINHCEGGFELYSLIGWKAANLAEIERLAGRENVPPWFVVTDTAFRKVLNIMVAKSEFEADAMNSEKATLEEAITNILKQENLSNHQKSMKIRTLWENIRLPDDIRRDVLKSYKDITSLSSQKGKLTKNQEPVYVAIRSSSQEEDRETATGAGEFETYLYIHGEEQLLYYLKRTWSGLWTERAIQSRILMGVKNDQTGGGIIVQRMVHSRVSGVLQTVNIPKNNLREMVINAGLGLGEGVVSGTVAADYITVSKEILSDEEPLRFQYITSDKTEQISFNKKAGFGTTRMPTLYHQRLRPALEYVELCQLVKVAGSLEKYYGYPLDIEFGIEENRLWLLQVRPVALNLAVINETLEKYPVNFLGSKDL